MAHLVSQGTFEVVYVGDARFDPLPRPPLTTNPLTTSTLTTKPIGLLKKKKDINKPCVASFLVDFFFVSNVLFYEKLCIWLCSSRWICLFGSIFIYCIPHTVYRSQSYVSGCVPLTESVFMYSFLSTSYIHSYHTQSYMCDFCHMFFLYFCGILILFLWVIKQIL